MTKEAIKTDKGPQAIGPYSQAIAAAGWVYVSGQIPLDPAAGTMKGATVAEQTEQALSNLSGILEASGSSLAKVVKTTVYLTDMGRFAEMNEVYSRRFTAAGGAFPARATVQVSALPKGALVEIDAVALR